MNIVEEEMTTSGMQQKLIDSSRASFKARLRISKSLPEEVFKEQLIMDEELSSYLKDLLEFNFHNGFATLGVLEFDKFEISETDINNKKFKFKYNGKLYASLRLLHMLTNTNKEIKEKEEDIMQMIENYYVISENIPFEFDNDGNITRDEKLATHVNRWTKKAEFECRNMTLTEESVLEALDKYVDEAIKSLVSSIENTATEELNNLIG